MDSFTIPTLPKITNREFKQHHHMLLEDIDTTYQSLTYDELKKYFIHQTTTPTVFTIPVQSVDHIDETTVNLHCKLPVKFFGMIPEDSLMVGFYYKKKSESTWTKTDGQLVTSLPSSIIEKQLSGLDTSEEYEFKGVAWDNNNPSIESVGNVLIFQTTYIINTHDTEESSSTDFEQGELDNVVANSEDDVLQLSEGQTSGYRISPIIDLSTLEGIIDNIIIKVYYDAPTGTSVTIETSVSYDGGTTWTEYEEIINDTVPQISQDDDLSNAQIKIKQTLESDDPNITPTINKIEVIIETVSDEKRPGPEIIYPFDQAVINDYDITFICQDDPDVIATEWKIIDNETGEIIYEAAKGLSRPTNISPPDNNQNTSLTPTLESSDFTYEEGTHVATKWTIRNKSTGEIVYEMEVSNE